ncbi:hypothetical protein [Flavobacterium sp.]|uniref:hypothetical protein n=1 Tax=Flavobacterium sp. TaxID=239 RepID=UPI0037BE4078
MKLKIVLIFLLYFLKFEAQSLKFQILDSLTNSGIEFVSINLLNGNGFYSDEEGRVTADFSGVQTIELSHVSYENIRINTSEITDVIYLKKNIYQLKEIELSQSNKKKYLTEKLQRSNETSACGFGAYGFQLATLIKVNTKKKCFLDEVSIPIVLDKLWMKTNNNFDLPYSIVQISFLENNDGLPSDSLISNPEYFFIDKDVIKNEVIKFKLKSSIEIFDKGIFCSITLIGKADKDGNLVLESPIRRTFFRNKEVVLTKYLPLQIPLKIDQNGPISFSKNSFSKNSKFSKVRPPVSVSIYLSDEDRENRLEEITKEMNNFKINIGFKYHYYE